MGVGVRCRFLASSCSSTFRTTLGNKSTNKQIQVFGFSRFCFHMFSVLPRFSFSRCVFVFKSLLISPGSFLLFFHIFFILDFCRCFGLFRHFFSFVLFLLPHPFFNGPRGVFYFCDLLYLFVFSILFFPDVLHLTN